MTGARARRCVRAAMTTTPTQCAGLSATDSAADPPASRASESAEAAAPFTDSG